MTGWPIGEIAWFYLGFQHSSVRVVSGRFSSSCWSAADARRLDEALSCRSSIRSIFGTGNFWRA